MATKVSIVVPVGDADQWAVCEESIRASLAAYAGDVAAELLPCFDLGHRGVYAARNEGLARATGDWIAWVDCDDVVELDWFGEIARAIAEHGDCDVIQFEATEVKNGKTRRLGYPRVGFVPGEVFARAILREDEMPTWLWTRVFRRGVLAGETFQGRVYEDYRMFLCVLPRIKNVWSIGRPIYRYVRRGSGLSNYLQTIDGRAVGEDLLRVVARLPAHWQRLAKLGLALVMADVALHTRNGSGARCWVRRYLPYVLFDFQVPFRLKAKCLLASLGVRR